MYIDPDGMAAKPPTEGEFEVGYVHTDADGSWKMNEDKQWEPQGETPWGRQLLSAPKLMLPRIKTDHQRTMDNPLVQKMHETTGEAAEIIAETAMLIAPIPKVGAMYKGAKWASKALNIKSMEAYVPTWDEGKQIAVYDKKQFDKKRLELFSPIVLSELKKQWPRRVYRKSCGLKLGKKLIYFLTRSS